MTTPPPDLRAAALTRRRLLATGAAAALVNGAALLLGRAPASEPPSAGGQAAEPSAGGRAAEPSAGGRAADSGSGSAGGVAGASGSSSQPPGQPGVDYTPVIAPDTAILPWTLVDGVKVFHLVAEEVRHEFAPGLVATCWGYNGRVHGPLIEAVEGDRVRVYVTNRLPEPTTVHWHGVLLDNGMDGLSGLTQTAIAPGGTWRYEWTFRQHGTLMYHPHHDEMTQMAMGMMGLIVIHPRQPAGPKIDHDFALLLSEWRIVPGTSRPDPTEMTDFNILTINGRCYPGTSPLVAGRNQRVRIRMGNLSAMEHHAMHIHGHAFTVTATDGGPVPESARLPETTVLVPVGSTRDIEFIADNPGDWAFHCHMSHHVMNQMGHGLPNLLGIRSDGLDEKIAAVAPGAMTMGTTGGDMGGMQMAAPPNSIPMAGSAGPFGAIGMGGMFTILKVRDQAGDGHDPGWYAQPAGSGARAATADELAHDGITL
jgi:FtsP/CotA-like multicopper oxidase with cupredoxin domain